MTHWFNGDTLGLDIPADAATLIAGGVEFLTRAFHASGALPADNAVVAISASREISGGSTGRKLLLDVVYAKADPALHTELFVKFSRDFDDPLRDGARVQMELEVLLALISREPNFPIAVPVCYFTDFHRASGSGILITQRIPYGVNGVEPHYLKSLDYQMPDPLGHYKALIRALARLAGTHKAGKLSANVERYFPFEPEKLSVSARAPHTPEAIAERVERYRVFAQSFPQLLPEHLRSDAFIDQLAELGPQLQALQPKVQALLQSQPEMIALCHWNAHVDNAWFWRGGDGELSCGLMDWGNVSQMNVAMALWGCLSAAEPELWDNHLDELIELFIAEFAASGGPALDKATLTRHLQLYVAMMGLEWMLDAPALIQKKAPRLAEARDRFDPIVQESERARSQLLILIVFLNLWGKSDMGAVIDKL